MWEDSVRPRRFGGASGRPLNFPFLKDRCRNSILTLRCLIGTGKSLTFVSVRHFMRRLLSLTFMLCSSAIAQDAHHLLQITVRTDNVTCTLTGKVMPCNEVKT